MAQVRKKEYHSVKKRKISFVKETCNVGAPRWRPYFEQRSRRPTKLCHTQCWKRGFLFFIEAWIQRHQQSPRIVILKVVCRFAVLLLSTFSGFSIFTAGFLCLWQLNFAHYCVALLDAPPSDRESWSIVIDARRCSCPIVCGFRRRDDLLAWGDIVCEPLWAKISNLILGGIRQIWAKL